MIESVSENEIASPTHRWFFANLWIAIPALCGFIAIALLVASGRTQEFDERVLEQVHSAVEETTLMNPERMEEIVRDWTALGGYGVLVLLLFGMSGYLILSRRRYMLRMLVFSVVVGTIVAMLLKDTFDRDRPSIVEHKSNVSSSSFPSGHSMMSMVAYLTLGSLLARISHTRAIRVYCLASAILVSLLVGFSRLCVGVHYPTDVVAGWLAGIAWVCGVCLVTQRLEQQGRFDINR